MLIHRVIVFISLLFVFADAGLARNMKKKKIKKNKKLATKKKSKKSKVKVLVVSPGQSIQDVLDVAPENSVIHVRAGDYVETGNALYGLRISKNNIRIIGENLPGQVTRIHHTGNQEVGVYVAPEGCDYKEKECETELNQFTIEGIVVEGFPKNGIQTRFVDGFQILNSQSIDNLNNGIYPTYSKNGLVQGCTVKGSLDAGLWLAGSRNINAIENEVSDSVTGIEVTVCKDLYIANNTVYNNVVGIGMYHANMAGTSPDFAPYDNWVFENNHVFDNNRLNNSPPGSFQSGLVSGVGVLMVGIRGQTLINNVIEGNDSVGVSMLGFCEVQQLVFGVNCEGENGPKDGDPSANDNKIINNTFQENGSNGVPGLNLPGVDILYGQSPLSFLGQPDRNCFEGNIASNGEPASSFASDFVSPTMELPTAGCS